MGIISFLKEAGEKLFGKKPEVTAALSEPTNEQKLAAANTAASAAIRDYIKAQGLPADDLVISYSGATQTVTVGGLVATQEIREKIVLCCGNVEHVAAVADELQCAAPAEECQFHMVSRGDTLSAIAKKFYGNANAYMKIFEANKPMLSHPDKIYPGQLLRIPK